MDTLSSFQQKIIGYFKEDAKAVWAVLGLAVLQLINPIWTRGLQTILRAQFCT